jgi:hypothetical protein
MPVPEVDGASYPEAASFTTLRQALQDSLGRDRPAGVHASGLVQPREPPSSRDGAVNTERQPAPLTATHA